MQLLMNLLKCGEIFIDVFRHDNINVIELFQLSVAALRPVMEILSSYPRAGVQVLMLCTPQQFGSHMTD